MFGHGDVKHGDARAVAAAVGDGREHVLALGERALLGAAEPEADPGGRAGLKLGQHALMVVRLPLVRRLHPDPQREQRVLPRHRRNT